MVGSRIPVCLRDDILYSTVLYSGALRCTRTVQYRYSAWGARELSGEGGLQDFCLAGGCGFARLFPTLEHSMI